MRKILLSTTRWLSLLLLPVILFAQTRTITGLVTDIRGAAVPGASISVVNTNRVSAADGDGKFTLSVPDDASITISAAGFKSKTIKTDAATTNLIIQLEEDVARLDEVVVTGLATSVKRRNLANAVATVSSKELSGTAPAQTLDAALNGKIPGAYINSNSGAPGGGISVKLRGVTSVYGTTQPLYVVDGVFVDNSSTSAGLNTVTKAQAGGLPTSNQDNPSNRIADIRPEDIENIEILKGASAAAIYGSRAAAGVIIITTKRGKQGKTAINFSQDIGWITARKLLGVREFTPDRAASLSSDSATSEALRQQFIDAQAAGHIYDYENEIYGNTGFARNTSISLNGGGEKTTFYFSAAQKDEGGIVKNTGYRNSSLRLNVEHRLTDNIKIGVNTNYINTSIDRGLFGNDNVGVTNGVALSSTPSFAELHPDANGNYPNNPFAAANPLQTVALMSNNESVNRFITGLSFDATLQKSTKSTTRLIARGGFDFFNLQTNVLFPGTLQWQAVNKGTSIQGFTKSLSTNFILSLVNTYTPSAHVSFTTSAGITGETGDYNNILNIATQIIAGQSNVDQAGALTATQFRNKFLNTGIFVQEEATISDAVTLTGGVRFDRSSNNGDASKFYTYPKAGVSFNLTKAGIIKEGLFDNIKVRAAYGQANNVPAYGSKFTGMVIANIAGNPGVIVNTQEGQSTIQPERQTEFESGIDLSLLDGRLSFEFTYYNKTIQDFLMLQNLPSSSGFSNKWVNAGDLRNQGIELGMNARPVQTKKITWNTSVNFWMNRSKVTKLLIPSVPQGAFGYVLGSFQIQEGKSATQILGLDGANGVGVLGDAEPDFQMNTFNEITFFSHLSLRFLLHWKNGGDNINLTTLTNDFGGTTVDYDNVTNKEGLPDGVYRISQIGTTARIFVQDASYLRLREIGLYYSFTKIPVSFIKAVRLGVSLNNYFTITKYVSYDPEVSNFGTGFSTGVDVAPYPAASVPNFTYLLTFNTMIIMKTSIKLYTLLFAGIVLFSTACKKDYGNLNGPTIESFLNDASAPELNNLVNGTESGMRRSINFYMDDVGTIGRECYHFAPSEPRYVTDLLGANNAVLSGSNFYITQPWAERYRVVKNCNVLIQAATNSSNITAEQKKGYIGFAQMIKAYQLLMNLNLTDSNGIRIDVADPDHLGPFVSYTEGLTAIAALLDSAKTTLNGATVSFPLAGFTGFNDAAGLTQVCNALAARVAVYQQHWSDALTYLNGSFFGLLKDFNLGVYHVFGTGSGDQLNPVFFPQNQNGEVRVAHPSYAADIEANDDRINKATLRTAVASLNGLSSNRDVWVYTSSTAPIPIIRNEELVLIYAEANIQLDNLIEGVKALNVIRSKHNLPAYSGAEAKDALITELLKQRRYSLYFEGHRWIDLRRYNRLNELPLDRTGDDVWTKFPLPVTEQ